MKLNPKKVPESVRACLWFTDAKRLDWAAQKNLIVTQILNRGTWDAVQWVSRQYGMETMKQALRTPKRGMWFPQALNFWLKFFKLSLSSRVFQQALIRLNPWKPA